MKQKKKLVKRIIGFVLSLVMVLSMVPMTAFAAGELTITLNTNIRSANYTTSPYLSFTGSGTSDQSAYTFNQLKSSLPVVEGNQYTIKIINYQAPASNVMDPDYLRLDSVSINGVSVSVPETETSLPTIEGVTGTIKIENGALVIVLGTPTTNVTVDFSFGVNTAKLQELIDQAEEIQKSDLYYTDSDYYNGMKYYNKGVWQSVFGTRGKLQYAKEAVSRKVPNVSEIKKYVEELSSALSGLVPKTQLNAGKLYYAFRDVADVLRVNDDADDVADLTENPEDYYDSNYTRASWDACREAFLEAYEYLNTLFTDRNTKDAQPTAANKPENQLIADSYTKKLQNAYNNLIRSGNEEYYYAEAASNLSNLQAAADKFKALASGLHEADYTSASWTVFQSAMTELNKAQLPNTVTSDEEYGKYVNFKNAYNEAYNAYYFTLTPTAQEISVKFRTMDPSRARTADMKLYPGVLEYMYAPVEAGFSGNITLKGSYTLADLVKAAGVTMPAERGYWNTTYIGLFINGIYVTGDYVNPETYNPNPSNGRSYYYSLGGYEFSSNFKNVKLHPGDDVTLIYTPMTYSRQSPTVAYQGSLLSQYMNDIRYETFTEEMVEVEAGETATLTITQTPASMLSSGSAEPAEGLQLYISDKQESDGVNAPANSQLLSGGEKIITDENGQASIRLYEEGWYLIAAYDTKEDVMGDQNQDTGVVTPGTYYSANSGAVIWVHVTAPEDPAAVKEELKAEVTAAAAKYSEYIFSAEDWQRIQDIAAKALTDIDDAETIGEAYQIQQVALVSIKKIQSETLKANTEKPAKFRELLAKLPEDLNELTKGQQTTVEALISCNEGMSDYQKSLLTGKELEAYQKILEMYNAGLPDAKEYDLIVEVKADTVEATEAVQAMTKYLQENTPKADQVGAIEPNTLNRFCTFSRLKGFNDITSAAPMTQVQIFTNVDYAAYLLTRDAENHTISGDGWSISDQDDLTLEEKTRNSMSYDVLGHLTVKVGDTAYEIKSVSFEGVDAKDIISAENSFYDHSNYKGKDPEYVNMYFADAYKTFSMPYNEVKATITWGPVSGNTYLAQLDAEFAKYNKTYYTAENWNALVTAYKKGVADIENASDNDAAAEALATAIAAMAAAEKKSEGAIGTVTVIVENTTYSKKEGAPWEGVLVNEQVELADDSSMMNCVARVLEKNHIPSEGTDSGYISSINDLAEFDGGTGAGWMATLNDWFVNEGLDNFTVANGKLSDGDIITIAYTTNLGADLGSSWENSDTSLKSLVVSAGTLSPEFSGTQHEYSLLIDGDSESVLVTPTASNKNFLVKTFLNEKVTGNTEGNNFYKRFEKIVVTDGDTIYVGCGEKAWPSMNGQEGNTQTEEGTWYVIHVVSSGKGASYVNDLIAALPAIDKITCTNYKSVKETIATIEITIATLSESEKEKVDFNTLNKAKERVAYFEAIDIFKDLLAKLSEAENLTGENIEDIQNLQTEFNKLCEEQKGYLTFRELDKYNAAIEWLANYSEVQKVEDLIDAIGEVTISSKDAIDKALEAYNNLTEEQKAQVSNYDKLLAAIEAYNKLIEDLKVTPEELEDIIKTTAEYIMSLGTPSVGSIGGEWAVIGLERYGETVSADYINTVKAEIENNLDSKTNRLNSNKSTENSRIILALTSMGYDATNFKGFNLVSGLNEMSYLKKQGINGPIWALIALDSGNYPEYGDVTREALVGYILSTQLADGGWALSGSNADPDMTGMALQALAPYVSDAKVKEAVDKAVDCLSKLQNKDGGYGSWGTVNSESCAQVITALTALGIDPKKDERFIKNGFSVVDALASFYVAGGGFKHTKDSGINGMATEQGFYALVAYERMLTGKNSLYDMTDVKKREGSTEATKDVVKKVDETIDRLADVKADATPATEDAYVKSVVDVTKALESLSTEEKDSLSPNVLAQIEEAQEKAGEINHKDGDVVVDGVEWNIKVEASVAEATSAEAKTIEESAGKKLEDGTALVVYDITLTDVMTGTKVEPGEDGIKITLPVPESAKGYDHIIVAHLRDDGVIEYVIPEVNGNMMTFKLSSLSPVSIVGYNGEAVQNGFTDDTTSSPNTGDNSTSVYVYALLMMLCAGAFVTIRRKER